MSQEPRTLNLDPETLTRCACELSCDPCCGQGCEVDNWLADEEQLLKELLDRSEDATPPRRQAFADEGGPK